MISAKIIADSICANGKRITTFELTYPRFIHSEFMTHRAVSKNSASSRAIPIAMTIQQIQEQPAMPVFWGKNQTGMTAKESVTAEIQKECESIWLAARDSAIKYARKLSELGLHKQIANRILEPWVYIKVVATATEWDNLFHLRCHADAQPEFQCLANCMLNEYMKNKPLFLSSYEYHLPYVTVEDQNKYDLDDCIKLSASLCAQVSYRKSDESIEKAFAIYDRLVASTPVHASPFEHQATPLLFDDDSSGNFFGWEQYRQCLLNNVCRIYKHI